jgi:hypothetical protein
MFKLQVAVFAKDAQTEQNKYRAAKNTTQQEQGVDAESLT